MKVKGRDLVGGLPKTITVASDEIEEALKDSIKKIVAMIKVVLEQTPPELFQEELKVPVFKAEDPLSCVAEGTGIMLDKLYYIDN